MQRHIELRHPPPAFRNAPSPSWRSSRLRPGDACPGRTPSNLTCVGKCACRPSGPCSKGIEPPSCPGDHATRRQPTPPANPSPTPGSTAGFPGPPRRGAC
jgi:hypothetical protein